jgi:hypothetical protein
MKILAELTLDQMLDDPIVHLTMARDGVRACEVRGLIARLKSARAQMRQSGQTLAAPCLGRAA